SMPNSDLGLWMLCNFSTVAEVRKALPEIYVYGQFLKMLERIIPVHFAVHDPSGDSIVIEYTKGKLNIFDNKIGIMTNSPTYDWQLTNLSNYANLTNINVKSYDFNGETISPIGQGSGLLGLPGDWTPPSRFVRVAICVKFADPGKDASEAINTALHILNVFDIPKGVIKEVTKEGVGEDITEWIVVKDLTNQVFHFRTFENLSVRAVDLKKLDFGPGAKSLKMDITGGNDINDITDSFKKSGSAN
ncbi:MAG: linear amide C-N hydrolase, partial [Candidatus Theseobacter exili]|nr:linear amide C-N hydrolase [Candidatus Theseobacter exili]